MGGQDLDKRLSIVRNSRSAMKAEKIVPSGAHAQNGTKVNVKMVSLESVAVSTWHDLIQEHVGRDTSCRSLGRDDNQIVKRACRDQ